MRFVVVALLTCWTFVGSPATSTLALAAPDYEVLTASQESKGWRVLHEGEETSPLDESGLEHASIVEDWASTEPVAESFPVPKAVLLVCGLLIVFGAYRVATRD